MRLFRPWILMRCLYPGAIFRIKTPLNILYLTFDDGPDPASTPALLDILEKHKVKAVFFCTGKSASEFPGLINQIRAAGHMVGNHTYSHCDGWRTSPGEYLEDAQRADEYTSAQIFRPPFGHLKISQFRKLTKKYHVFFWDLMPYDFDRKLQPEKVRNILMKNIRPGSVIVLHDNPESSAVSILHDFINDARNSGYRFNQLIYSHS